MSEAKHTPGPWHAHHDCGWLVVESSNEDLYVKVEKGSTATRHLADARLIAAAPELLEAGKALVNALDRDYLVNDDQRQGFDLLLAAIAKATGGVK